MRILGGHMFRMEWLGMLATMGMAIYMGLMMGLFMDDLYSEEEPGNLPYIVDWIYLVIMPGFGSVMNRTVFNVWHSDAFTKRLALMRSYPIPVRVIVGTRIVQSIVLILASSAIILSLQYSLAPELRGAVSGIEWIAFGFLLTCYGLIVNLFIIWLEIGHNGRSYTIGYFAWFALVTIAVIASAMLEIEDQAFSAGLQWAASDASAAILPISVLISAFGIWRGYRWIVAKVHARSLRY